MTATLGADVIRAADGTGPVEFPDGIITGTLNGGDISSGVDSVAARDAAIAAIYGATGIWTAGQTFRLLSGFGEHGVTDARLQLFQGKSEHDSDHWINVNSTASFDGHYDPVMLIGYNAGSTNIGIIRNILDEGSIHIGVEGYYYYSPTQIYGEWYVQGITADGTKRYRPFQSTFNYLDGVNENFIDAESTYFFNSAGTTLRMKLASDGLSNYNAVAVDGSSDVIQLRVKANSAQTASLFELQDNSGGALWAFGPQGRT